MMYAFSRDGAIPAFFHTVDVKRKSPIRAVWLACTLSFILALPSLGSTVAFSAATSIATIGLYISYGMGSLLRMSSVINGGNAGIPIVLRVVYRKDFVRGPFHLGRFSYPVAIGASTWIVLISILFILPELNPVNTQTFNYAVVAVGIVLAYSFGMWFITARKVRFSGVVRA
jgi:amino acid transporter